ncbi:MAG: hypothetical protein WC285_04115, partial [Candidatus Gracilibacteria bacterium]
MEGSIRRQPEGAGAADLRSWGERNPDMGRNRSLEEIQRARYLGRIQLAVAGLAIAAIGIVPETDWWKKGFNDSPKAPYLGVTLEDQEAQRRLLC